jgi:hypothetical protein
MRLPRDQIIAWQAVDAARATALDIASTSEQQQHLEQTFLVRLLLRDEHGRLSVEAVDQDAPRLLELGTVVVRPFDQDPTMVRLSFRPASPALAAVRPARAGQRPKGSRARRRSHSSRDTPTE